MKLISSSAARRERLHHVPNSHLPLAFEIVEVNDLMQSGTQLQPAKTSPAPSTGVTTISISPEPGPTKSTVIRAKVECAQLLEKSGSREGERCGEVLLEVCA